MSKHCCSPTGACDDHSAGSLPPFSTATESVIDGQSRRDFCVNSVPKAIRARFSRLERGSEPGFPATLLPSGRTGKVKKNLINAGSSRDDYGGESHGPQRARDGAVVKLSAVSGIIGTTTSTNRRRV